MKKINLFAVLIQRTRLFAQGVNKNYVSAIDGQTDSTMSTDDFETPLLEATRKFKIALISAYTFLISLFGAVVYISVLLDPKFPF